jgi:hypothetical protein
MASWRKTYRMVFVATYAAVATCFFGPTIVFGQDVDEVLGGLLNIQLAAVGADYRVSMVETYTIGDEVGRTVYFDDRTKQLAHHFVPGDPRRGGFADIAWLTDRVDESSSLPEADTSAAIGRAMNTWDSVKSTNIPLTGLPDFGLDWGYVQWLLGLGGVPGWYADVTHAGFLPGAFFDALEPGGSTSILGVTFTFVWVDGQGDPTDINKDGKIDVAFREIYYSDAFPWGINTNSPIDVETVALHESGHGLSQGHFGAAFRTPNGKLHFAPRAVMNAGYSGVQQRLRGTDVGGHSSIWASWPHR